MNEQSEAVEVVVNGDARAIDAGLSVRELLERLGLEPRLVVVEHNREILDRSRYGEIEVRDGDQLELVHFVGGG